MFRSAKDSSRQDQAKSKEKETFPVREETCDLEDSLCGQETCLLTFKETCLLTLTETCLLALTETCLLTLSETCLSTMI